MKLLFKQRLFSWFDSYDIYNEDGSLYLAASDPVPVPDDPDEPVPDEPESVLAWHE